MIKKVGNYYKMTPHVVLLVTFTFLCSNTFSIATRDSINQVIELSESDSVRVQNLLKAGQYYFDRGKSSVSLKYLEQSESLSAQINDTAARLSALKLLSEIYYKQNDLRNFQRAFEAYHKLQYTRMEDGYYNQIVFLLDSIKGINSNLSTGDNNKDGAWLNMFLLTLVGLFYVYYLYKRKAGELKVIANHDYLLNERKQKIDALENEKFELSAKIDGLVEKIDQKDAEILNLNNSISELNNTFSRYSLIKSIDDEVKLKTDELKDITDELEKKQKELNQKKRDLKLLTESLEEIDYGLYNPHFTYNSTAVFNVELERIRDQQKEMIKNEEATVCDTEWTVSGSKAEGKRMLKQTSKLMLRAFNGECDAAISKVSWNNIITMEGRIEKAFESINKSGETHQITINEKYKELKKKELYLVFEKEELEYKEKEEQRQKRERLRDEERAQKEFEKAMKEAEAEEKRYENALTKAKAEVENAKGKELEELNEKIKALETKLEAAHKIKERAVSQAQLTKSGYVYIISNIGSFGEHVFKIGMTRRLDPLDRIYELGDASVPFDFDVHAMIYSDNAPELEYSIHQKLDKKRVNLVNSRTEFFKITIDEIEQLINELKFDVKLIKMAEAREFRESLSLLYASDKS